MARESFLLRTDPKVLAALRRWAEDELRSTNGQLDFILRKALKESRRLGQKADDANTEAEQDRSSVDDAATSGRDDRESASS